MIIIIELVIINTACTWNNSNNSNNSNNMMMT